MCQFQLKKKVKLQTHTLDAHGETCLCETYGKAFHIHQNHRATRKAIRQVIKQMMFVKTRLNVKTHLTNLAEDLLSTLHKSPQLQTATLTENGKDFLSLADLDSDWLEDVNTKLDQYKLNLQIEKFNKIDLNQNGATTAQIQTNKMAANQTMTTWIPDKMAANQTRTTWLPDVNNEDRFSENPLENKRTLFINFISVHKYFKKLEDCLCPVRQYPKCGLSKLNMI